MIDLNNDGEIPEIKLEVRRFEIKINEMNPMIFHCILLDTQIPLVELFFEKIEKFNISWENAKEETLKELLKIEFKGCPEHLLHKFENNSRSSNIFRDLENIPEIQNLIKSLNRKIKLDYIID